MERHDRRLFSSALGLLGAALILAASQASAQTLPDPGHLPGLPPAGIAAQPPEMMEDPYALLTSLVRIEAKAPRDAESASSLGAQRSGTGVLIGKSTVLTIGYLLVETEALELITPAGKRIPGSVAGYDPVSGFGLIQSVVPLDGQVLELGDSDQVKEMQRVITLGHGEGVPTELLVVSRKPFAGSWEYVLDSAIFTYPPVNNWSGAALLAADGKLIGIGSLLVNDAATDRRGIPGNLYVPVNLLKPILKDMLATGRRAGPPQPWMGLSTEVFQGNLVVSKVTRGGPAEEAGLNVGDIIVGVGEDRVDNQSDFYRNVWKLGPAGVVVPLRVLKSGNVREVTVKTMDRMSAMRKPHGV